MAEQATPTTGREWQLAARPDGWPKPSDFALVEAPVGQPVPARSWSATSTSRSTPTCAAG